MDWVNLLTTIAGVAVIALITADAVQVTLGIRPAARRLAPSIVAYRAGSKALRRIASRADEERSERILGWFAPVSILLLLAFWFVGHSLGFGLIWTSLPGAFPEPLSFFEAFYFSGVTYLTIGFGDVAPVSDWARALAVVEGLIGVVMVALVLGFLGTLYSGYLQRERRLVTLDLPGVDRITPIELVAHVGGGSGGDERLRRFFEGWSEWAADIVTWHTTYPLLALFRSQHPGQSWITALGLVTDSAVITLIARDGDHAEADQMYRMGIRAILLHRERADVDDSPTITREMWQQGYDLATSLGLDLDDPDAAYEEMTRLRSVYVGTLEAMIDALAAPRGFWSRSSDAVPRYRQ